MRPEANLQDKTRPKGADEDRASGKLAIAGTERLDQSALERMRPGAALQSNAQDRGGPGGGGGANKEKAFGQPPNYPYASQYTNGVERWGVNADGTKTGYSRYTPDRNGVTRQFCWQRDQSGREIPDYAVETSRNAAGDVVHNYFGYNRNQQGVPIIDRNTDRGQILVHLDGRGARAGGYVRAPHGASDNCNFVVFDNNIDVVSKQRIPITSASDTNALIALERRVVNAPGVPPSPILPSSRPSSAEVPATIDGPAATERPVVKATVAEQPAIDRSKYDGSTTYPNAVDYWNNNPNGTKTGFTRYHANAAGETLELHWTRDQYNRETPLYAEKITTDANTGDTIHKMFDYKISANGQRLLYENAVSQTKVVHKEGNYEIVKQKTADVTESADYDKENNPLSTRTTTTFADGRTTVIDFDKSGAMQKATTIAKDGSRSIFTYDAQDKDGAKITFAYSDPSKPGSMVSRSWNYIGADDRGNQVWQDKTTGDGTAKCYNLQFDLSEGSWSFYNNDGVKYVGTPDGKVEQYHTAEGLDLAYRLKYSPAEYEQKRSGLQKELEKQGITFSDRSGVVMKMDDGTSKRVATDLPNLAELEAVRSAMKRYRPDGMKEPVKFTFLKDDVGEFSARYVGNGEIYVSPWTSVNRNCFADSSIPYRSSQYDPEGESLETTLAHEYTHLIENPIYSDPTRRRQYAEGYGVIQAFDQSTQSYQWCLQGKEVDANGRHYVYKTATYTKKGNFDTYSINIGAAGKPVLAVQSNKQDSSNCYAKLNPNGTLFVDRSGRPTILTPRGMQRQAAITPSSHYMTGQHASTEARTKLAMGGATRDDLYANYGTMYRQALIDDQAYIDRTFGQGFVRNWQGEPVLRTNPVVAEIQAQERTASTRLQQVASRKRSSRRAA